MDSSITPLSRPPRERLGARLMAPEQREENHAGAIGSRGPHSRFTLFVSGRIGPSASTQKAGNTHEFDSNTRPHARSHCRNGRGLHDGHVCHDRLHHLPGARLFYASLWHRLATAWPSCHDAVHETGNLLCWTPTCASTDHPYTLARP